MSGLVARLCVSGVLRKTPEGKKMFRYTMVSVISTVVSVATLRLVYGVFRLWTEVPSTLFANVVATVPVVLPEPSLGLGEDRAFTHPARGPALLGSVDRRHAAVGRSPRPRRADIGVHYFDHDHLIRTAHRRGMNLFAFGVLWVVKFLVFQRLFRVAPAHAATDLGAGRGPKRPRHWWRPSRPS